MTPERWEYGSEFHSVFNFKLEEHINPIYEKSIFPGTGRCALKLIIDWGCSKYKWKRIWLPSYFCPDVVESVLSTGIKTEFYYDDPFSGFNLDKCDFKPGDAILVNNLFGYRTQPDYDNLPKKDIYIIEDHSHDPWSEWSLKSEADWCFASLRKSLPISDGALLWSPKSHHLPPLPEITSDHYLASLEKYTGMLLKTNYFNGLACDKEYFRGFLISGERKIGLLKSSGITEFSKKQLKNTPVQYIREKKNQNRKILTHKIGGLEDFNILKAPQSPNSCPFSLILIFNTITTRDFYFKSLSENRIYPAILWPVKKGLMKRQPSANSDFSSRMLSIHCDFRYSAEDIYKVSESILAISEKSGV